VRPTAPAAAACVYLDLYSALAGRGQRGRYLSVRHRAS